MDKPLCSLNKMVVQNLQRMNEIAVMGLIHFRRNLVENHSSKLSLLYTKHFYVYDILNCFDVTKCIQQIEIPNLLHMYAPRSELPSNISTM